LIDRRQMLLVAESSCETRHPLIDVAGEIIWHPTYCFVVAIWSSVDSRSWVSV